MSSTLKEVTIYTDGGAEPNPGPGGYGVILVYGSTRKELVGGFRRTTNNRMEITAAIKGLQALKQPCKVTLFSDSKYVVDSMAKGWALAWQRKGWRRHRKAPVLNADLWKTLLSLCQTHEVQFEWIKGHAGHPENERCDVLSMQFLQMKELAIDEGFESAQSATEPPSLIATPPENNTILAVYEHVPGDDEGNARRKQESLQELIQKVIVLDGNSEPGSPPTA
jgi:ribonuclease HI